jgi:hypothetical protein
MTMPYKVWKKLKKKREQEQADVHAVHIGISGDDNLAVSQAFQPIFNIQRMLQQIEFFIFIDNLFCQAERIQRLTAQAKKQPASAHPATW